MRNFFYLQLVVCAMILVSCSSDGDIISSDNVKGEELYADYSISFENYDFDELLKDRDSITVPVFAEYISGTLPQTKGVIIPTKGTVERLGNVKTLWKYGVGENKVPMLFCGNNFSQMTISELWKISVTIDLTNENYAVRGFVGEWSGWNGTYLSNPQTRFQGASGTSESPVYYTYVYRVISDINGRTYGIKDCYVPFKDENNARIYYRIYE